MFLFYILLFSLTISKIFLCCCRKQEYSSFLLLWVFHLENMPQFFYSFSCKWTFVFFFTANKKSMWITHISVSLRKGLSKYYLLVKFGSMPIFVNNVYCNMAVPICLRVIHACFVIQSRVELVEAACVARKT